MALSILMIGDGFRSYGLYDSKTESFIMKGTQEDMSQLKHRLESLEQQADNKAYANSLREKWITMLIKAGNTEDEATEFLKKQLPFLYED